MSAALAVPLFLVSLAVTLAAARLFARRLDRLGVRFGFPEALIGLLTAVAADGPNVSSALFALLKGAHDVGVGVLVGSNAFQLAAMIGVSALLAGAVRLPRETVAARGRGRPGHHVARGRRCCCAGCRLGAVLLIAARRRFPYLALVIGGPRLRERPDSAEPARPRAPRARRATDRPPDAPTNPTHHLLGLIVLD